MLLSHLGFHLNHKLSSIFPESCLLILLGILLGLILFFSKIEGYALQSDTFFLYLLPPIILDSGYFMPYRTFFDNLGSILLFAIVGTIFNTTAIGLSVWGCSAAGLALFPIPLKVRKPTSSKIPAPSGENWYHFYDRSLVYLTDR